MPETDLVKNYFFFVKYVNNLKPPYLSLFTFKHLTAETDCHFITLPEMYKKHKYFNIVIINLRSIKVLVAVTYSKRGEPKTQVK